MGDILFITAFLGLMIGPFVYFAIKGKKGFWFWVGTIASMGICLGVGELASKIVTGATLSKNFWNLSLESTPAMLIVLSCMALSWTLLLIHLAWKKLTKK